MIGTVACVRTTGELVQRMNQCDRQRLRGGWRRIGGIADAIATRNSTGLRDIREQMGLIASYLLGALMAGVLIVNGFSAVVYLPLAGVGAALLAHMTPRLFK